MRRDAFRHHHVVGGDLADPGPRLDPVAGPGLDGRMLDCTRAWGLGPGAWGRRCALDIAQDVLLGDTTGVPAARNAVDVDAVLGRDLANEGPVFRAQTSL